MNERYSEVKKLNKNNEKRTRLTVRAGFPLYFMHIGDAIVTKNRKYAVNIFVCSFQNI